MHGIEKLAEFEKIIKYHFKDKSLLTTALTHPSYTIQLEGNINNYQRLEFLGDAILTFIITDELYKLYPLEREGKLASYRSALIHGAGLANFARKIRLPDYVLLSEAESKTGGMNKDSILEDVFEGLIGAIYLDSNIESARDFIKYIFCDIEKVLGEILPNLNPKGKLQEMVHQKSCNNAIKYVHLASSGPNHNKYFTVNVLINGEVLGSGSGSSKKIAEEEAAIQALENLKTHCVFKNKY